MSELKVSLFVDGKRNNLHIKDASEELVKSVATNFFRNVGAVELEMSQPSTEGLLKGNSFTGDEYRTESNKETVDNDIEGESASGAKEIIKVFYENEIGNRSITPSELARMQKEDLKKNPPENKTATKKLPILNHDRTLSQSMAGALEKYKKSLSGLTNKSTKEIADSLCDTSTKEDSRDPDYFKTGIKVKEGVEHYKTRYFCKNRKCGHKGNHYLPEGTEFTYCHQCEEKLLVREASEDGFPNRDEWGNFYVADRPVPEGDKS
jgi:hypothetical protein